MVFSIEDSFTTLENIEKLQEEYLKYKNSPEQQFKLQDKISDEQQRYINITKKVQDAEYFSDIEGKTKTVRFGTKSERDDITWDSQTQQRPVTYVPKELTEDEKPESEGMFVLPSRDEFEKRILDMYTNWDAKNKAYYTDDGKKYMKFSD